MEHAGNPGPRLFFVGIGLEILSVKTTDSVLQAYPARPYNRKCFGPHHKRPGIGHCFDTLSPERIYA